MEMLRRRRWFLPPMLLTFVVDVTLTLNGQSAEYWLGNTIRVEEANPIAYILLVQSPQVVSVGYGGSFTWSSRRKFHVGVGVVAGG